MKDVTDDQLKAMWRQTQILAHRKMKTIQELEDDVSKMAEHSSKLEAELIKRGYRVTRRIWSY